MCQTQIREIISLKIVAIYCLSVSDSSIDVANKQLNRIERYEILKFDFVHSQGPNIAASVNSHSTLSISTSSERTSTSSESSTNFAFDSKPRGYGWGDGTGIEKEKLSSEFESSSSYEQPPPPYTPGNKDGDAKDNDCISKSVWFPKKGAFRRGFDKIPINVHIPLNTNSDKRCIVIENPEHPLTKWYELSL